MPYGAVYMHHKGSSLVSVDCNFGPVVSLYWYGAMYVHYKHNSVVCVSYEYGIVLFLSAACLEVVPVLSQYYSP